MNIEIANRLVQLRKQNGLSQEELAARIGISRQAVSKWERAEASPDTDNLILLARLYGVSLDELLFTQDEIPRPEEEEPADKEGGALAAYDRAADGPARERRGRGRILRAFPFPVLVTIVFLLLGFCGNWWHPGWLVFLTIPLYYGIVEEIGKDGDNQ